MTDTTSNEDRPFRAEELLAEVKARRAASCEGEGRSTRDVLEELCDEMPEPALPLGGEIDTGGVTLTNPAMDGPDDQAAVGKRLPTSPAIAVPNHELIRCLGEGAFGQVWLARHAITEHYRACKLIPKSRMIELRGLRQLKQRVPSHPNLLPVEDVGVSGDWLYCLMPLADNAASDGAVLDSSGYEPLGLDTHLRRHGRLSSREVCELGAALAGALEHLHAHGVTHGDVKPANVLRHAGRWSLADYGLVSEVSGAEPVGETRGYVPPEGPGRPAADQFALGVVLMEMLTGWSCRMLAKFKSSPIEQLGLDRHGSAVRRIILRVTADAPEDRFGSMSELAEALRAVDAQRSDFPGRARRWLLAVAGVAILAGAVWLVAVLTGRAPDPGHAPIAAATPLRIESFEVIRHVYEPGDDVTFAVGPLGPQPSANVKDDVTVHAEFSGAAYCYLLSLDTDGLVMCRLPVSPDASPLPLKTISYPEPMLYHLHRGPGAQGFMLIASSQPLPPWSEFTAIHGLPDWPANDPPPRDVLLYDGTGIVRANRTRDPMPPRGTRLVRGPVEWAKSVPGIDELRFLVFPVLPRAD